MQLLCNGKVVFIVCVCVCTKIAAESSNVRFPATSAEVGIFQETAGRQTKSRCFLGSLQTFFILTATIKSILLSWMFFAFCFFLPFLLLC